MVCRFDTVILRSPQHLVQKNGDQPAEVTDPHSGNDHLLSAATDKLVGWLGILEKAVVDNDNVLTIDYTSALTPTMRDYLKQTLAVWQEVIDLDASATAKLSAPKSPPLNYIGLKKEFEEMSPLPACVNRLKTATEKYTGNRTSENLTKLTKAW